MEAVARKNYIRSAPGWAEILACAISHLKSVAISEIARNHTGSTFSPKKKIIEVLVCENCKRNALGWAGIIACTIGRAKEAAVSELREIAGVAYLGQITNIGSGRA